MSDISSSLDLESAGPDSPMATPSQVTELKRFDIIGDHSFIQDNEFNIEGYIFPAISPSFSLLNSELPEQMLSTVDVCQILRQMADCVGRSIQGAFHQIPPNFVLKEISKKFGQVYPQAQLNFQKIKQMDPVKFEKYKDISVSLWIFVCKF